LSTSKAPSTFTDEQNRLLTVDGRSMKAKTWFVMGYGSLSVNDNFAYQLLDSTMHEVLTISGLPSTGFR
jgi:hypothetical protein